MITNAMVNSALFRYQQDNLVRLVTYINEIILGETGKDIFCNIQTSAASNGGKNK
jgi:hypothetical protein